MSLFERTPYVTSKSVLDYLVQRQKVIASNVANISTPGYKTRDVSFESVLKSKNDQYNIALKTTNPRHISEPMSGSGVPELFYAYNPVNKNDGVNDVDLDKELLKQGETQTNFNLFSELLINRYQTVKRAIAGSP